MLPACASARVETEGLGRAAQPQPLDAATPGWWPLGSGTQGKAPHESRSPFCHMRSRASQAGGGGTDAAPSWNARPRSRSPAFTPPGQPCPFVFTPGQRVTAASCPSLLRTAVPSFGRASRRPPSPPFPPPTHFLWRVPCAFVRTHTELCMFLTLYSQYCAIDLFPTFPPRLTYTHPCGCVCTPNTASPGAHCFRQQTSPGASGAETEGAQY